MDRYQLLKNFNAQKKGVYLPYVMLGFPTQDQTLDICRALIEEGVHGLELGFPFRDPVADGPVLQAAANVALDNGFKLEQGVELVHQIRALNDDIPLTGMSYYNMINVWGAEKFFKEYGDAGLDGLLVPDLPPEHADELAPLAQANGLNLVFIASPNTSAERMGLIKSRAAGFVYVVTKLGITGVDDGYYDGLTGLFDRLHSAIDLPAIAGFGISEPEQAEKMIKAGAHGVISGSKVADIISSELECGDVGHKTLRKHTQAMLGALDM